MQLLLRLLKLGVVGVACHHDLLLQFLDHLFHRDQRYFFLLKLPEDQCHRYYYHLSLVCGKGPNHSNQRLLRLPHTDYSKNHSQRVRRPLAEAKHLSPLSSVHLHHQGPLFIFQLLGLLFSYMSCCLNLLSAYAHHAFLGRFVKQRQIIYYYFLPWEREVHHDHLHVLISFIKRFFHSSQANRLDHY